MFICPNLFFLIIKIISNRYENWSLQKYYQNKLILIFQKKFQITLYCKITSIIMLFNWYYWNPNMEVGEIFKEFELLNQNEKLIKSSDIKGTPFVLFAYPRASTPGCTKEVCSLRDHFQVLKDKGFRIFGISNDKPAKNKKFSDKHKLQYDLLSDMDSKFLESIGVMEPEYFDYG